MSKIPPRIQILSRFDSKIIYNNFDIKCEKLENEYNLN
jgi:hypothetical protein